MSDSGDFDKERWKRKIVIHTKITWITTVIFIAITGLILGFSVIRRSKNTDLITQVSEDVPNSDAAGIYTTSGITESDKKTDVPVNDETGTEARHQIYLTFDDGPSSMTEDILDILKEYDVKATFFVLGREDEYALRMYKRIVDEGHTLGMHSYSHKYADIYKDEEAFLADLERIQNLLYDATGVWPRFYRFPGGSSNRVSSVGMQVYANLLNQNGITYFDWNIASGDAVSGTVPRETIVRNCTAGIDKYDQCVILLHDATMRKTSVTALPEIIQILQDRGDCEFLPITDETPPVQHAIRK